MFIYVTYRDSPELSKIRYSSEIDLSVEQTLLVNPDCPVRIMLEYIRKKCKLGKFTNFDLCDENGRLKGLFNLPTYSYAKKLFEHKKTYYIIVIVVDPYDTRNSVIPQLNHENKLYEVLKDKVTKHILYGDSPSNNTKSTVTKSTASSQGSKPSSQGSKQSNTKKKK